VRGVFHYADVSVCCVLSATLVPSPLPKGSTDVLVVDQVSCGNRDEVDVSYDVSMSLVGAVITGVLLLLLYVLYWTRVGRGVLVTGGGQRSMEVRTSNRYVAMLVGVKERRGVHCKVTVLLYSVEGPRKGMRGAFRSRVRLVIGINFKKEGRVERREG
jgi:hypothetical protein